MIWLLDLHAGQFTVVLRTDWTPFPCTPMDHCVWNRINKAASMITQLPLTGNLMSLGKYRLGERELPRLLGGERMAGAARDGAARTARQLAGRRPCRTEENCHVI